MTAKQEFMKNMNLADKERETDVFWSILSLRGLNPTTFLSKLYTSIDEQGQIDLPDILKIQANLSNSHINSLTNFIKLIIKENPELIPPPDKMDFYEEMDYLNDKSFLDEILEIRDNYIKKQQSKPAININQSHFAHLGRTRKSKRKKSKRKKSKRKKSKRKKTKRKH
jgi:hypothetical protein